MEEVGGRKFVVKKSVEVRHEIRVAHSWRRYISSSSDTPFGSPGYMFFYLHFLSFLLSLFIVEVVGERKRDFSLRGTTLYRHRFLGIKISEVSFIFVYSFLKNICSSYVHVPIALRKKQRENACGNNPDSVSRKVISFQSRSCCLDPSLQLLNP